MSDEVRHDEHVGHPRWAYALGLLLTASLGVAYLGFVGPWWALLVVVVSSAAVLGWLRAAREPVRVDATTFTAGRARLPLEHVGAVTPLDAAGTRRLAGVDADARAYLLLRSGVPAAVRVDVDDPADPTPYWLVSTARPDELAAALVAGRDAARRRTTPTPEQP